jgi:hypothetical protein
LSGKMRIVTGGAFTIFDRLMFYFGSRVPFFLIFVAFITEFALGFREQLFVVGGVRVVAGSAFAIFNGLMFGFSGFRQGVVTIGTEGRSGFVQHFGDGRAVRIMTGRTFAVFGGLMFELGFGEEVIVAFKANLALRAL